MAGALTRTTTISATEPLSSLGPKLSQLIADATIGSLSDAEAASDTILFRYQATAPSSVTNDFWHDSATKCLKYYSGASGFERWIPVGVGQSLKNSTGSAQVAGNIVGFAGAVTAMSFNNDAGGAIIGSVGEAISDTAFGLVRTKGLATVAATGTMTRGDFIKGKSSSYLAISNGTTLDGSFGIALESAVSTASYALKAHLFPYNKT